MGVLEVGVLEVGDAFWLGSETRDPWHEGPGADC